MLEIAIVLLLVVLNGVFALSELAIVSARRSRLKALAAEGRRGANRALALASDPGRFLSTVQIGITAVGLIAGAYSGATLTGDFADYLVEKGVPYTAAGWLGYVVVFAFITYLSLIIGELVPKNLALRNAETIACLMAPLMTTLSRLAAPAVWLLDVSTRAVFWLLRQRQPAKSTVTEEEIKTLIAEAEGAGVLEAGERHADLRRAAARRPSRAGPDDAAHRCRLDRRQRRRRRRAHARAGKPPFAHAGRRRIGRSPDRGGAGARVAGRD